MKLLAFLLRRSRSVVVLCVVTAAISGAGGVALIALILAELNREVASSRLVALAFAGLFLFVAATRFASQVAMARLGQGAVADLLTLVCRKILALPLDKFEAIDRSALIAVLTEDIAIVANALNGIPQICINAPLIVICLIYTGWLSPAILACGLVFAPLAILLYLAMVKPAIHQFRAARAGQDALVGHIRTLIDGFRELKQHRGRSDAFLTRSLAPAAATVRDRGIAGQTLFALAEGWGQLAVFGFLGGLLFVLPAFLKVDRATLTGVVLVVLYVMGPLDVILTWLPALGRAKASIGRVEALLPTLEVEAIAEPASSRLFGARPALRDSLVLDGITYTYPGDAENAGFAVGPVELTLRPGEIVILAGGNGCGKTTLVKVLSGLYTPEEGTIRIDGHAITDEDRSSYRQLFTVLFADGHLFKDHPGLDRFKIEAEAEIGLERLGLKGKVSFDGLSYSTLDLSQGQRRRLALLSARLEDRPICIFDEWAANQDPYFKGVFYNEILPELRDLGKALLVISHDEEYYHVADRLIRLRDGMIVADHARYTGNSV